jgi:hypothetical protein
MSSGEVWLPHFGPQEEALILDLREMEFENLISFNVQLAFNSRRFMEIPNWENERSNLRAQFTNGNILKSNRQELERYLVVLANSRSPGGHASSETYTPETESFTIVVRHLLEVRLGEELHEKSSRASRKAFWISIAAITVSLLMPIINGCWYLWSAKHSSGPTTSDYKHEGSTQHTEEGSSNQTPKQPPQPPK